MLAITYDKPGSPDVLTLSKVPIPHPGKEQLLVRVKATAVNRADILQRRGKYPPPPGDSPILGLEIAGEVVKLGEEATGFKVGDAVCGLVGGGGYAEYCVIDHKIAMPIPKGFSFVEAAGIPEAFLTANEAIFTLGQLLPEENILIHAGASGVGTAGIQLAKLERATVYATVGSAEKKSKVHGLGANFTILYKQTDFVTEIMHITNQHGVNVVIDFVGGSYLMRNLQILQPNGRLICVGLMGGTKAEINLDCVLTQRLQIKGLIMRKRSVQDKREITKRFCDKWFSLLEAREIQPVIDSVFPLTEVQKAHQRMEENANIGKIILEVV